MHDLNKKYLETSKYISQKIDTEGAIGLILGSGLGELAEEIENPQILDYSDIPHFPNTTVPGHAGKLVCGYLNGVKVICMKGRFHFYEGHDMKTVAMPVKIMKMLGVKALILTNAAGGVNRTFVPGTLMLITDFINFMGDNPLRGENDDEVGPRFPDMTKALDPALIDIAKEVANKLDIDLKTGTYMAFRGPNYETPAEIKFAEIIGADAVGMSTVPEILTARHCGLPVMGISCITNFAAGITGEVLSHDEITEVANKVKGQFKELVKNILINI